MNLLDINYRTLIILFTVGVPVSSLNSLLQYYGHDYILSGFFFCIVIVNIFLVCLFRKLWLENRPRNFIQTGLTIGNIGLVTFSISFLIRTYAGF